ncbi:MAG: S53 family peptidase, partial [Actinomycetota bacterium]
MRALRRSTRSRITVVGAVLTFAAALAVPAAAGPSRISLAGSRSPAARSSSFVRAADRRGSIGFQVFLGLRDPSGATALLARVSDPTSASYGHYLRPAAFRARFSRPASDVRSVTTWLRSQGFSVGRVPLNHLYVPASGTVAQVERAFGVRMGMYRSAHGLVRAAAGTPSVPAALGGIVRGVLGLDDTTMHAADGVPPAPPGPAFRDATPCSKFWGEKIATNLPKAYGQYQPFIPCSYTPAQLQSAYGIADAIAAGNDGTGVTVAIVDAYASPTIQKDLDTYSSRHGLPQLNIAQITQPPSRGKASSQQGWYGEETLDVEAVHSMAPGAKILYWGAQSSRGVDLRAAQTDIVDNARATIMTDSWGALGEQIPPSAIAADNQLFIQAGIEGIGVYFSSGDNGDEKAILGYISTDWPAGSAFVTAVGGTSLALDQSNQYLFETAWGTAGANLKNGHWAPAPPGDYFFGSGGGTDIVTPQPTWQAGVVPAALSGRWGGVNRVEPDVSLDADPYTGFKTGETGVFPTGKLRYAESGSGGTSLSSPLFAGIMALADQLAGSPHGFVNPALYALAGSAAFHDVVQPPQPVVAV